VTLPPFKVASSENTVAEIIKFSRKTYARPRFAVEEEINSWAGMSDSGAGSGGGEFPIICSACGKETTVPFEPQPGRPVYCRDCLAKIKAGELKPVRVAPGTVPGKVTREPRDSESALASLGIEFESASTGPAANIKKHPAERASSSAPPGATRATHQPFRKQLARSLPPRDKVPTYEEEEILPAQADAVSLSALTSQSADKHPKHDAAGGESIEELRNALKNALSHLDQS
jgi:CxxC-x17-CxxC domain-containing protein